MTKILLAFFLGMYIGRNRSIFEVVDGILVGILRFLKILLKFFFVLIFAVLPPILIWFELYETDDMPAIAFILLICLSMFCGYIGVFILRWMETKSFASTWIAINYPEECRHCSTIAEASLLCKKLQQEQLRDDRENGFWHFLLRYIAVYMSFFVILLLCAYLL